MAFDASDTAYLENNHSAAMITLRVDGTPHVVRVGVALVDGKLLSSGTQSRVRTRHVRRDPRATLFVFDQQYGYLAIESTVRVIESIAAVARGGRGERFALGLEVVTEGLDAFIDTFGSGYVDLARLGRLLALGSRTGQLGGLDAPTDRSTAPRAMSTCRCAAVMPVTPVMSMRS